MVVLSVAIGARHIKDEFLGLVVVRVGLVFEGGEGAEEEVGDVSEDGRATCGDAVLREDAEEIGEDLVEVGSGLEFGKLAEEGGGEVGLLEAGGVGEGMLGADTGGGVGDGVTATAASAGAVLATGQVIGRNGVDGLFVLARLG